MRWRNHCGKYYMNRGIRFNFLHDKFKKKLSFEGWDTKEKVEECAKNKRAEELCGMRDTGTPVFLPHELGYACPICGSSDEVNLHWSEYASFLWCKKCNIDIPSCLCVKYYEPRLSENVMSVKEQIEKATKRFLDSVEGAKEMEKTKTKDR